MILSPFSGAGGGCLGAQMLGLEPIGIEFEKDCCATRAAAGLPTIRQDVTRFDASRLKVEGLIGSPPCQDFSKAGKRAQLQGQTGPLVWEPLRLVRECLPEWVALEQVDMVLPIWHEVARVMRWELDYSVWVGVLDAADFGVPQNRKRAILIARRGLCDIGPPEPTHAEHPHPLFDGREELPWVSMAEALGWTCDVSWRWDRKDGGVRTVESRNPAPTVLACANPMWSYGEQREGHFAYRTRRPAPTIVGTRRSREGAVVGRSINDPSQRQGAGGHDWPHTRPATTVMGTPRIFPANGHHPEQGLGHASTRAVKVTLEELAVLQDFPPDFPFSGNKSSVSRQIGNAWPRRFAAAVIGAASGREGER